MSSEIALIGAGAIGALHAEAVRQVGAQLRYVVDTQLTAAEILAGKYEAEATTDIEKIWSDPAVTAVVIGVPNRYHRPLTLAALQAGKDVLLEKPMGLNAWECDEIIEAMEETGQFVQVGLVHRYTAVGQAARSIVASGELGDVHHVKALLYQRRGIPGLGRWFTTKKVAGGGALIDLGVHLIDFALQVTGFPEVTDVAGQVYQVFGKRMDKYVYENMWAGPPNFDGVCDVEDSAHAFLRCRNGMTVDVHVTWAENFASETLPGSMMGFFGDTGGMTFELFGDRIRIGKVIESANVDEVRTLEAEDQFQRQMKCFLQAVESREVVGATAQQAREVQAVIDRIYADSRPVASARPRDLE